MRIAVRVLPALGFVMLKPRVVVPLKGMMPAPNALLMVGGTISATVKLAFADAPAPASVDEIADVVFAFTPVEVPVTVTLNVQEAPAASEAPVRLTLPDPAHCC